MTEFDVLYMTQASNGGTVRLLRKNIPQMITPTKVGYKDRGKDPNAIPSFYFLRLDNPFNGDPYQYTRTLDLDYQDGPVKEKGLNGWQHREVVTTILDRLRIAQDGPYACEENAQQIQLLEDFIKLDGKRTARREMAKTEGTSKV